MKTEIKFTIGILIFTALIIFGGLNVFKKNFYQNQVQDYSKNIQTDLNIDLTQVVRDHNPKINTQNKSESDISTSSLIITEFLDYECPACATAGEYITKSLLEKYGSKITIVRKIFPVHGQSAIEISRIVLASRIFGEDTYQKIHTKLFEDFDKWIILGKKDRDNYIKNIITGFGLNYDAILIESQNEKYLTQIMQDKDDSEAIGVHATPSFLIGNKTLITGGIPVEEIEKYIDNMIDTK